MYNNIRTNITALNIQRNFNISQNNISTSLERISSGLKINQAKDNTADYTLSSKLKYQLSGLNVGIENLSHGNNLLNIANDVLENMIEEATTIRSLCLKALNSTISKDELAAIQEQVNQISAELERQRQTTKYNGAKVFETKELKEVAVEKPYEKRVAYIESTGTQYIDTGYIPNENTEILANVAFLEKTQALQQYGCITNTNNSYSRWHFGAYQNKLCSFKTTQGSTGDVAIEYDDEFHEYYLSNSTAGIDGSLKSPGATKNSNVSFTLFARNGYVTNNGTSSVGYHTKSKLQDFKIYEGETLLHSYIPVVDYEGKAALYDQVTKEMLYNQGSGEFIAGEEVEDTVEMTTILADKEPTTLQIGQKAGINNTIDVSLGFNFGNLDFDISNSFKANFAIKKANELIEALTNKLGEIGAAANRLNSISKLQETNKINMNIANSSLADADIAKETSNMVQAQILQEISSSLFAQSKTINSNLAQRLLMIA
ncbi:MAG: hypothetical protein IJB79_07345 [Candidatus Gastranaerophilales bacterium]|nr:hypothetical protein [Candidatus Gastranaerophilales bacterium]